MMRYYLVWTALLATMCFKNTTELRADALSELRVSENGRFLVREDGSGFFPLADTAWGIAWELDRNEVERYLQHRKEQKFNTIALIAFPSYEGIRVVPNAYGDKAFKIDSGRWNPVLPITTQGRRPEKAMEYDYWDHLEYIVDTAESKGMHVVLLPAWGGCVAGDWGDGDAKWESVDENPKSEIIFNATSAYRYGRWIGQRFKSKKNIVWMMGGDRSAVYGKKDYRDVFQAMAEGVADGVNGVNRQDGKADYSTTLMSYHPRKWMPNSSEWFHNAPWLDFNSIQDQPKDQIVATTRDYGLSPTKPTWLFEGGYEYRGSGKGLYKAWQIRFQGYQTVFAGGFGVTYGSMNVHHCKDILGSLDEEGALDMQHLFSLMTSVSQDRFLDRIPDRSLIEGDAGEMSGGEGVRSSRLQATRGGKGDYAMVYSADGCNIRLNMDRLSAPLMNGFWFNPRNGKWRTKGNDCADRTPFARDIPAGPGVHMREFDPPGSVGGGNDWVLVLMAVE